MNARPNFRKKYEDYSKKWCLFFLFILPFMYCTAKHGNGFLLGHLGCFFHGHMYALQPDTGVPMYAKIVHDVFGCIVCLIVRKTCQRTQ